MLLANKVDLEEERVLSRTQLAEAAAARDFLFFEVSSVSQQSVEEVMHAVLDECLMARPQDAHEEPVVLADGGDSKCIVL